MTENTQRLYESDDASSLRKRNIVKSLSEYEEDVFLPSSVQTTSEPKKKKNEEVYKDDDTSTDDWLGHLMTYDLIRPLKGNNKDVFKSTGLYGESEKKKGKKKKKKDNTPTDFSKEFESESTMLRTLLVDQSKLTDSMQKAYDAMASQKSSTRGIGKFTTDIQTNIIQSRQLQLHIVDKLISTKKTIADLSMKERKEFGVGVDGAGSDLSQYAGDMLKQMISTGQKTLLGNDFTDLMVEGDDTDIMNAIMGSDINHERSSDADKYLRYENDNVTIYAVCTDNPESRGGFDHYFIARDEDGNDIDDYPLPNIGNAGINRSTNILTDQYGKKYTIIWE